jgi:hypothetical protein
MAGRVERHLGHLEEARTLYSELLEISMRLCGPSSGSTWEATSLLRQVLQQQDIRLLEVSERVPRCMSDCQPAQTRLADIIPVCTDSLSDVRRKGCVAKSSR